MRKESPWRFIPTLYFPPGMLGVLLVAQVMGFLKLLGYPNSVVALVSVFGFAGSLRFLYAPWLDALASKRALVLLALGSAAALYLAIGGVIALRPGGLVLLAALLLLQAALAFVASAYDTAVDGYYMRALDEKGQARFIGIKTAWYRAGNLFVGAVLAWGAAKIAARYGAVAADSPDKTGFYVGNAALYGVAALVTAAFLLWNVRNVPVLANDQPVRHAGSALKELLRDYLAQRSVGLVCALILLYRLGEGLLAGMMTPFILDSASRGGLGVGASSMSLTVALTGMPMMIVGGIAGGWVIARYGLRRTFLPLALAISVPNVCSVLLALYQPTAHFAAFGEHLYGWLLASSAIESLFYGVSFSAVQYYVTVMASESGRNKTSVLAVSSALQAVGFYVPMMLSGAIQSAVGYVGVFALSVAGGLPALFLIPRLPLPRVERENPHA